MLPCIAILVSDTLLALAFCSNWDKYFDLESSTCTSKGIYLPPIINNTMIKSPFKFCINFHYVCIITKILTIRGKQKTPRSFSSKYKYTLLYVKERFCQRFRHCYLLVMDAQGIYSFSQSTQEKGR